MVAGEIKKILTLKENDWGRFQLDCAGKEILAVGVIHGVSAGMSVVIEGVEENNQYGQQYKITKVLSTEADKNAGARRFLTDGYVKYIGVTKANALINAFGSECVEMFDTEEGRLQLSTVKGITLNILEKALPSYEENKKYRDIVLFLNGSGTKNQIEKIYKKYGDDTVKILKKNPYRLQMDLDGFGFIKADTIALASGINPDSIYRIMAAIKYVLDEASTAKGHCYLTITEIKEQLIPLLAPMPKFEDISEKVAENAAEEWSADRKEKLIKNYDPSSDTLDKISQTVETRKYILDTVADALLQAIENNDFVNLDGKIYTKTMYEIENGCATMVAEMCKKNPVRFIDPKVIEASIREVEERKTEEMNNGSKFIATEEQRDAVFLGLMHRISIISGGPGRGKTAISEIIAHAFLKSGRVYDKEDIIMLAPTGQAAQRITESTGYDAMTAHRAVMALKRGELPPKNKLILCDESSMADIYLFHSILRFAKDSNLILVGDVDQIASVGPGKVLRDLIDCGKVPYILLKQGHRNSGTIAHNSLLINSGLKIDKYCYDEHFVYIPATSDTIFENIISDYIKKVAEYGIKNVMLCCAMRERGVVAVNKLNRKLQEIYTKGRNEAKFGENLIFRVGDRVMQTKNDYNFVKYVNKIPQTGVFNGEKGTVVKVFYDNEEETYKMVIQFDDGSIGGYTKATAINLTLAYATTLHKCQGSEAACMMMAYTFGDYMLLNRSLFYTGETRAKKEFRFYGEEQFKYGKMLSAFDIAVGRIEDSKRNTSLCEMINELV